MEALAFYAETYQYLADVFQAKGFQTVNLWTAYQESFGNHSHKTLCATLTLRGEGL